MMLAPVNKVILRFFFSAWGNLSVCQILSFTDTRNKFLPKDTTFLANMWCKYFSSNIWTVVHQSELELSTLDQKRRKNRSWGEIWKPCPGWPVLGRRPRIGMPFGGFCPWRGCRQSFSLFHDEEEKKAWGASQGACCCFHFLHWNMKCCEVPFTISRMSQKYRAFSNCWSPQLHSGSFHWLSSQPGCGTCSQLSQDASWKLPYPKGSPCGPKWIFC